MNKIFLACSVVVNLALIAAVVGVLEFLLASFAVVIIVLVWYIKRLAGELKAISDEFDDFYDQLEAYEKHIDEVHSLEVFYGDQTLQGLIRHSRQMLNDIYDFQVKYFIEEEEEIDRTEKEKNEETEKESLLYRSPSESDS